MQVADDIYQLKVPMRHNPLGYTYSYLLKESKTLIDAGIPGGEAFSALEKQLEELGTRIKDLQGIIITHMHNDHVGLIDYIRQRSEVKTTAHKVAEDHQQAMIRWYSDIYRNISEELQMLGGGSFQHYLSRFEHAFREDPKPLKLDSLVDDGAVLDLPDAKLQVIWTPGHAAEHICLHDEERRILFSGDHVLPKITSHVSEHTWEKRDPLGDYLSSLLKVRDLPVNLILPGHEQSFTDLPTRIAQLFRHHEARLEEVRITLRNKRSTVFEVASAIHWDSRPWPLMDFWTKRMAATETYAHLIYLRNREEITEETVKGTLYYATA